MNGDTKHPAVPPSAAPSAEQEVSKQVVFTPRMNELLEKFASEAAAREFLEKRLKENRRIETSSILNFYVDCLAAYARQRDAAKDAQIAALTKDRDERPTRLAYDCALSTCNEIGQLMGVDVNDTSRFAGDELVERVRAMEAENRKLQKYTSHLSGCKVYAPNRGGSAYDADHEDECSCGLRALLSPAAEGEKGAQK